MIYRLLSNAWKPCLMAGLAVIVLQGCEAVAKPLAVWDVSTLVDGGIGYRDNVLRSSVATESSAFIQTVADASLMRLSETDSLLMIYVFGEDTRYIDAPSVNYEQVLSGIVKWSQPVGERSKFGLQTSYLYQHQIFDASATEVSVSRILVLGHSATLRPSWEYLLNEKWSATLEGIAERQIYEHVLDDFWEGGGELLLKRSYGNRSSVRFNLKSVRRSYDTREQLSPAGVAVPGADLAYLQSEGGLRWTHYWDAERRWRTTSRASYLLNRDNGSGYFDYDRIQLRLQVRRKTDRWSAKANLRLGYYRHRNQEISGDNRYRSNVGVDCRLEREVGERWKVFANAEHEWSDSNDARDEYRSWMAGIGAGVEL